MFGYVDIYAKDLSSTARECYQGYYCGLCRTLRSRYGLTGQLSLSFDMAFVALLLSALYEPPTSVSQGRCTAHPWKARPRTVNQYVDYAADMTAVLAYYNYEDNWSDEHKYSSHLAATKLEQYIPALRKKWPDACGAIEGELCELNRMEAADSSDLDALCGCFGRLLGAVFCVHNQDPWASTLMRLGYGLGCFIYLMDAYDDLEKDKKNDCFNALAALATVLDPKEFEKKCKSLLTVELASCAEAFEMLPIVKDTPEGELLYNVLYSGIWGRYELRRAMRERLLKKGERKGVQ